jgi:gliding motility-associated-like protein
MFTFIAFLRSIKVSDELTTMGRRKRKHFWGLIFCMFMLPFFLLAEGTRELRPTIGSFGKIKLKSSITGDNTTFALLNGPITHRMNVHVCDITEKVYMGFDAAYTLQVTVRAPDGTFIFPLTTVPTNGTAGNITSYAQAVAGPNVVAGAAGYVPFTFSPTMVGDYSIEFFMPAPAPANANTQVNLFDVTVVDKNNKVKLGRLWSEAWEIATEGGNNPFSGSLFVYTDDHIVTKVDLNGILPNEFVFSANNTGTANTGNPVNDRKSKLKVNETYPLYKVFLNDPDSVCYPSGMIGAIVGKPYLSGCTGNYCINVEVTALGQGVLLLDLNGTKGYQSGTQDRYIQYSLAIGMNCIPWDGKDGLGAAFADTGTISVNVQYINGLTNIPMYDVETNLNGYKVTYVRPATAATKTIDLYWDDTNIPGGAANTTTPCNGSCHSWPTNFGDQNTMNTWWFIANSYQDLSIILTQKVDANVRTPGTGKFNDTTICASVKSVDLHGGASGSNKVKWSILAGTGKIGNDTLRSTTYTLSKLDSMAAFVSLQLSTNNGTCPPLHDTITIHIHSLPTVKATPSKSSICIGEQVTLTPSGAVSYIWDNGVVPGVPFSPTLTKTYTVTGTDANGCKDTDTTTIQVNPLPSVTASASKSSLCKGEQVTLKGAGASTYTWDNGVLDGVAFIPSTTKTYTVTGSDVNNCKNTATTTVTILPSPIVTANASATSICQGNPVTLTGSGASSYAWDHGVVDGVPFSPSSTSTYTVIGTNTSGCKDTSQVTVTVAPAPLTLLTLSASKTKICRPIDNVTFTATVLNASPTAQYTFYVNSLPVQGPSSATTYLAPAGSLSDNSQIKVKIDQPGCYNPNSLESNSLTMDVYEIPDAHIQVANGKTVICEIGEPAVLLIASVGKGVSYEWYKGTLKVSTASQLSLSQPQQSGNYTLKVTNGVCPSATSDTLVKIYEMPDVTFAVNPLVVQYPSGKVPVIVTGTGLSLDTLTRAQWVPSTWLENPDTLQPFFLPHPEEETIHYTLVAETGDSTQGCRRSFPYTIINTLEIKIPNAFSPNGDGRNDTWVIDGMKKYPQSTVNVFNRWGNKVYVSNNGYEEPWDGRQNGTELGNATYYYLIDLKGSPDHTDRIVSGSLTVVK